MICYCTQPPLNSLKPIDKIIDKIIDNTIDKVYYFIYGITQAILKGLFTNFSKPHSRFG